ncbi:MAG TPA: hypothetical protein PK294_02345 [Ignavibacteria bacterium]|nr:hypothetical protein [Ignavibacteria bacterium]HQY51416.1 hypothetical protein [Ignavibacteria bacterium]HRA99254.1 hypothetical protein [Ignavibacteria bacterium]
MSLKKFSSSLIFLSLIIFSGLLFQSCESNDSPTTNNTPASTVPVPQSPENNSTVSTLTPLFNWAGVNVAETYKLQVSENNTFTSIVLDVDGITSTFFSSVGSSLQDSTTYYWRVKGLNTSDTTDWSIVYGFAISLESINPTTKVLVELFTNTSCIPCVEANQYLDGINSNLGVTINDPNVLILRVHTTLYAGDPFYLYNTADNNARMIVYPGTPTSNPRGYLLGAFMNNYSSSAWTNVLNQKLSETRSFAVNLTNVYDSVSRNGNITVKIKQVSGPTYNDLVYHIALSESEIQYNAPNGETEFENTFRDLVTPPSGQPMNIATGQTNSYDHTYTVDSAIDQDHAYITVFAQRTTAVSGIREVMGAERVKIK